MSSTTASSFTIYRLLDRLPWSRGWSIAIVGVVLLLVPVIFQWIYLQDVLSALPSFPVTTRIRPFFPPLVIIYLLTVIGLLERTRDNVARSLRPLVQLDDETYADVVEQACRVKPVSEMIGFGVGIIFFLVVEGRYDGSPVYYWLWFSYYVISLVMFGAVGWSVVAVIAITRLTNSLLRQPIEVDIFDVTPLEPVGLQSLYLSLVFLGLVVLSFPTSPYPLASWQSTLIYGVLAGMVVLVFFVNMYGTHRLLAAVKKRHMADIEDYFSLAYLQLRELAANGQDTNTVATEVNAWAVIRQELKVTRTWPYNTEMLRTLVISVMVPLMVGLSRIVAVLLAGGGGFR